MSTTPIIFYNLDRSIETLDFEIVVSKIRHWITGYSYTESHLIPTLRQRP
jgi:hypothetical protein